MATEYKWPCPECGSVCEGIGPASLGLDIARHIRDHEIKAVQRAAGLVPKGLTPFDVGFLRPLRVSWDGPPATPGGIDEGPVL